jgi:ATP-binding cassette, subfamily F, member 3
LLEALAKFTGTVVFVSHDRYFIDKLATRIFEIESGALQDYPGNYEDYIWQKEGRTGGCGDITYLTQPLRDDETRRLHQGPEAAAKKVNPLLVRKLHNRRDELEEEIARREAEITAYELDLATFKSAEESIRLAKLIDELRSQLAEMMKEWEQIALTLDEAGQAVANDR